MYIQYSIDRAQTPTEMEKQDKIIKHNWEKFRLIIILGPQLLFGLSTEADDYYQFSGAAQKHLLCKIEPVEGFSTPLPRKTKPNSSNKDRNKFWNNANQNNSGNSNPNNNGNGNGNGLPEYSKPESVQKTQERYNNLEHWNQKLEKEAKNKKKTNLKFLHTCLLHYVRYHGKLEKIHE